jgi:PAS domain S-box-containing protein
MPASTTNRQVAVCLELTRAISRARTLDEIYSAALDSVADGLGVSRACIRLIDPDGVMRFKASRGLSEAYRDVAEGYAAWTADSPDPEPIIVSHVTGRPSLDPLLPAMADEGIAAMMCIPLVNLGRVVGKLGLYYQQPHVPSGDQLQLAGVIAAQVAFAIERARSEDNARRGEERLRFALDAALMGTWEWDVSSQTVRWSDNLEKIHGLPPGTFDGSFQSYQREIHADDRDRVMASLRRALEEGVPHEVEYRIVHPDGTVRWVEGKGRVEFEDGRPVRMTGVCVMVSRRKEAELARLAAAEEASRLKDEFLATLSHELRTPLNAILGWVQMLQGDLLSTGKVHHAIDVIGRNAKLQAQLIEDILDVSRIITGKLEIERRPLLVPQLVDNVLGGVLPVADAKRIQLSRDVPADLPVIDGDPKRLQQVLGNIVSNAIKFTPEQGRVHVRCTSDENAVTIQVRDSGIGIAADFLPFVFDRFRQADSRLARAHGGLGLGLAIARHMLELHGGEISVSSDGLGRGATFEIRLPAGSAASQAEAPSTRSRSMPVQLNGVRVLVVDDHADSREFLAALLDGCGADVVQCDSVASSIDALLSTPVHLIVADLGMPEADGFELIEQVRRMDNGRGGVPAVAVSAYSRPEDRDRALEVGYAGYCPKPVEAPDFLRLVDQVMRTHRSVAGGV